MIPLIESKDNPGCERWYIVVYIAATAAVQKNSSYFPNKQIIDIRRAENDKLIPPSDQVIKKPQPIANINHIKHIVLLSILSPKPTVLLGAYFQSLNLRRGRERIDETQDHRR